jgi:hypothetical protein
VDLVQVLADSFNAPAVYDTGVETAPDGSTRLWLVMQLLGGSTLKRC